MPLRLLRFAGTYVLLPLAVVAVATYAGLSLPSLWKPTIFDLTVAYTNDVQGRVEPCG
ncbi:MAG: hypothetical protein M1358_03160 [Chloroflexi bacterium]|nr:hypothetical protein [Chloroflexota bacterium]